MDQYYKLKIIGDGKTLETAFRADLKGFEVEKIDVEIETGKDGKPILAECIAKITTDSQTHIEMQKNPDIVKITTQNGDIIL